MINEYNFRIFGLRRSGNHMIVANILSCFGDNEVYYFNDVQDPINLFESNLTYNNTDIELFGKLSNKLVTPDKYYIDNLTHDNKKCLIQTYEDQDLNIIDEINKQNIGKSTYKFNIIILRDPYNMIASRLKYEETIGPDTPVSDEIIELWESYAHEFIRGLQISQSSLVRETNKFTENDAKQILINYNDFVTNREYKFLIMSELKLLSKSPEFNYILGFGGGSSFNKLDPVDASNYLNRWKQYLNNKTFQKYLPNLQLFYLSGKIFGNIIDFEDRDFI